MNKFFVIFHDKAVKEVSQDQADFLMQKSCDPQSIGVKVDGSFIKYSAIAKILNESEYYQQYPERRPPETVTNTYNYPQLPDQTERILSQIQGKPDRVRALKSMMKGLHDFIESRGADKPLKAIRLYNQMRIKLEKYEMATKDGTQ
jgi:hypothetical protein